MRDPVLAFRQFNGALGQFVRGIRRDSAPNLALGRGMSDPIVRTWTQP